MTNHPKTMRLEEKYYYIAKIKDSVTISWQIFLQMTFVDNQINELEKIEKKTLFEPQKHHDVHVYRT